MAEPDASPVQVRVLIAEGDAQLRRGLRAAFFGDRRFSVVGEVARAQALIETCLELSPDIVVLGMGDGVDEAEALLLQTTLRKAVRAFPTMGIIALVAGEADGELLRPIRAGARGVLLRDAPATVLLEAVDDVMAGRAALDPRLNHQLFAFVAGSAGLFVANAPQPTLHPAVLRALSPREQEVLRMLAQGHRNKEIAARLGVSVGTVKTHLRHIYRKLSVSDRTDAVLTALQLRLPEAA